MVLILGIDPGPIGSALVLWDGTEVTFVGDNLQLADVSPYMDSHVRRPDQVAIEDFVTYRPLDRHGRETIKEIGALRWLCQRAAMPYNEIPRGDVLRHLTGGTKGGDVALRVAIYDRFGGSRRAAIGIKEAPGPLYGLTGSHLLAALAVALTAWDKQPKGD